MPESSGFLITRINLRILVDVCCDCFSDTKENSGLFSLIILLALINYIRKPDEPARESDSYLQYESLAAAPDTKKGPKAPIRRRKKECVLAAFGTRGVATT